MPRASPKPGTAALVGAGPGHPGLITVRGLELLRRADVVVYDALVAPELLREAPAAARLIDAGKRAARHTLTQDQTNALLVRQARAGRFVVRLKGGDPYLFGRGAEEAAYLARHGVACEVVPGVTSGIAAPALAGIPVTHRAYASSVTFATGHQASGPRPAADAPAVDHAALARLIKAGGTVCFYMGVGRLPGIVAALRRRGVAGATPAAVIQWGTTSRQRSARARLADIAPAAARAGLGPPAMVVVGRVAGIEEPGLDHFTRRPLFGRTVLIPRARLQASELARRLAELGARVLEAPTIATAAPRSWRAVDRAIRAIRRYDWLVLTSPNGAAALAERLAALRLDARTLAGVKLAAIGDATAAALRDRLRLQADFVPAEALAESLAAGLLARRRLRGRRVLLLRADLARPTLPQRLRQAGARVTDLAVYRTRRPHALPDEALRALRDGAVDWIAFTSSSTAAHLLQMLGRESGLVRRARLASIGPVTSQTLRDLGLAPTVQAPQPSIEALVAAIAGARP